MSKRAETASDKAAIALNMVYAAKTTEEMATAYAAWAAGYDAETAALGYLLPFQITSWVARYVPKGEGPLLDAGCGTGLSGPSLKALGYDDLAGLDLSQDMLAIADSRGAYTDLRQAVLGETLPWPDAHFRAFFSTGVFTIGHAPASGAHDTQGRPRDLHRPGPGLRRRRLRAGLRDAGATGAVASGRGEPVVPRLCGRRTGRAR
jgi:SAM-dependent methyltransferase